MQNPLFYGNSAEGIKEIVKKQNELHYVHRLLWDLQEGLDIPPFDIKNVFQDALSGNCPDMLSELRYRGLIPECLFIRMLHNIELNSLVLKPIETAAFDLFADNANRYKLEKQVLIFPIARHGNWVIHNLNLEMDAGVPRIFVPGIGVAPIQIQHLCYFLWEQYGYVDEEKYTYGKALDEKHPVEFQRVENNTEE